MILLVCESRKLRDLQVHNISHFSLLVRLELLFTREASIIFHKILGRKIAKRDSLSTLVDTGASCRNEKIKIDQATG